MFTGSPIRAMLAEMMIRHARIGSSALVRGRRVSREFLMDGTEIRPHGHLEDSAPRISSHRSCLMPCTVRFVECGHLGVGYGRTVTRRTSALETASQSPSIYSRKKKPATVQQLQDCHPEEWAEARTAHFDQ